MRSISADADPRPLSATSAVRHADVDGLRVILDLNTESYRVLDDAASSFWAVLVGEADKLSSFENAAREYDVARERWESELAAFAGRCVAEGLLERREGPARDETARPAARRGKRAGTLQALASMIATRHSLGRRGFRNTYERYAALSAGSEGPSLAAVLPAFTRAENFFIARRAPADCLLRSLSLYRFLRAANVPAEHVIGVQRHPFVAHAWVEF
ncbi:MAG TPA: lasso peptide biosynthesis B2 protein, partial [Xanthomonadales bacterium]|nr:lasso peptide biosynthesis B2 protein [Xanthomonadales bacterium]